MQPADELEAEGHSLIARGHSKLAEAQRTRASARSADGAPVEWISPEASPLGKRRTLALCRAGALESSKVGRKVLVRKASLDAFLRRHERGVDMPAEDEDLFGAAG
jgi:hypothetical protein